MTALCGGGTSSNRPEFGDAIYMGPAAIAALLNNIPVLWAVPLAAFIGHVTYNLVQFCSTDPPAVPTFSAQDAVDMFNVFDPVANIPAAAKFQDLIGAYLWHQVCQCDTTATPLPPTPPAAPTGMPAINPPQLPSGVAAPCLVQSRSATIGPAGANDLFESVQPLPAGTTFITLDGDWSPSEADTPHPNFNIQIQFFNASGGGTSPGNISILETTLVPKITHAEVATPTGATQFRWATNSSGTPRATLFQATVRAYCGGTSSHPGTSTPCTADPALQSQLDAILQLVTVIQRQLAPFAYVASTAHSALTGHGHFAIQGLIGVLIEITSSGSAVGTTDGDPDTVWQVGWINWGNADGSSERIFISTTPQTVFVPVAGQYTRLGYTLLPGVTATITELVREP